MFDKMIILECYNLLGECRFRVFKNKMLSRIFGPKKADVRGEWRKLRNEERNNVCSSVKIVRAMKEETMK
jgi:hypothetical protein